MKKIFILISIFILTSSMPAQKFSFGTDLVVGVASPNIDNEVGLEINIGYQIDDLLEIRFAGGGYISDFRVKSPYTDKQSYYLGYLEALFVYYPFITFIKPYAGIGLGYYFPHNVTPGHANRFGYLQEYMINSTDLENGHGVNMIAGFETVSKGMISFNLEFKYLILKSRLSATLIGSKETLYYNDIQSNLNMLTARIGIIFNF